MIALNSNLSLLQRSGIRQFTNLARTVEDCVLLTLGEPDFDTPETITESAVAAVPGSCFGAPGHIRISFCCSDERLQTGLNRLETFIKAL